MKNYIYGLGGRDISIEDIEDVYAQLLTMQKTGKADEDIVYYGVRGE